MAIYLSIDLGTTGCRSIIFDNSLNLLGESYEEYGLITQKNDWVEQDAELWWKLTLKTLKSAVEKTKIGGKTYYTWIFENPYADKEIKDITFVSSGKFEGAKVITKEIKY